EPAAMKRQRPHQLHGEGAEADAPMRRLTYRGQRGKENFPVRIGFAPEMVPEMEQPFLKAVVLEFGVIFGECFDAFGLFRKLLTLCAARLVYADAPVHGG